MNTINSTHSEREDDILSKTSTLSLLSEYPANLTTASTNTTVATTINGGTKRISPQQQRCRKEKFLKRKETRDHNSTTTTENNDQVKTQSQLTDKAWDKLIQALNVSGNIALASSVELFKATVLPSINLTKTYIVPEITSKLLNSVDENISQRIIDWSNVGLVFCNKLMEIGFRDDDGKKDDNDTTGFKDKISVVGNAFVEFVSSDQGRQCLVDGVALFVKCMDALRTPATKAFLDQMTIFILRLIECISSSSFQHLLLDTQEFIWSTIQTVGDSKSIEAIAEITADVCHALEMEQYYYKHKKRRCVPKAKRAKKRRERGRRNHYIKSRSTFSTVAEGENGIQEVLKSAIGDGNQRHHPSDTQSCATLPNNERKNSIPHQINITSSSDSVPPTTMEDDVPPSTPSDFHSFAQHRQEHLSSPLPDIEDLNCKNSSSMIFWKQLDASLTQKRANKISSISNKKQQDDDIIYHPNATTASALKQDLGLQTLSKLATTAAANTTSPTNLSKSISKKLMFVLLGLLLVSCFMLIVSCLGMYGLYTLLPSKSSQATIQQQQPSPQEVVIRIVYENPLEEKGQTLNYNRIKSMQIEQDDSSIIAPIFKEILIDN